MFNFLTEFLTMQVLGPVIGVVVTALLGWIASLYAKLTGKALEANHRAALQSALENGIKAAIQKILGGKLEGGVVPEVSVPVVLNKATAYVKASVPDAVANFNLSDSEIMDLLVPKLPSATVPAPRVVVKK